MAKSQDAKKEVKKKPAKSIKEKRAEKKEKKSKGSRDQQVEFQHKNRGGCLLFFILGKFAFVFFTLRHLLINIEAKIH